MSNQSVRAHTHTHTHTHDLGLKSEENLGSNPSTANNC